MVGGAAYCPIDSKAFTVKDIYMVLPKSRAIKLVSRTHNSELFSGTLEEFNLSGLLMRYKDYVVYSVDIDTSGSTGFIVTVDIDYWKLTSSSSTSATSVGGVSFILISPNNNINKGVFNNGSSSTRYNLK